MVATTTARELEGAPDDSQDVAQRVEHHRLATPMRFPMGNGDPRDKALTTGLNIGPPRARALRQHDAPSAISRATWSAALLRVPCTATRLCGPW